MTAGEDEGYSVTADEKAEQNNYSGRKFANSLLKKLNRSLPHERVTALLGIYTQQIGKLMSTQKPHMNVYSSFIYLLLKARSNQDALL